MITHGDDGRAIEITVRIEADPEAVWRAITQPGEMERWFPLHARGGEGGRIEVSWGDDAWWGTTLTRPEEGRHARFIDESAVDQGGSPLYMDYHLETEDGVTVVRFVHSGFGPDDHWDAYLDALDAGWGYFFRNLKAYLEHHAGKARTLAWARAAAQGARGALWSAALGALGLDAGVLATLRPGDPVTVEIGGDSHPAVLEAAAPDHTIAVRLPDLDQSLVFVEIEKGGDDGRVGIWVSMYEPPADVEERLRAAKDALVAALGGG